MITLSYLMQSRLARDPHIIDRVTACAASERISDPQEWAPGTPGLWKEVTP